jgi:hypothetical protein
VYQRRHTLGLSALQAWTAAEDELVRALPAPEAAKRTGRSLRAVIKRRHLLGARRPGRPGAGGE